MRYLFLPVLLVCTAVIAAAPEEVLKSAIAGSDKISMEAREQLSASVKKRGNYLAGAACVSGKNVIAFKAFVPKPGDSAVNEHYAGSLPAMAQQDALNAFWGVLVRETLPEALNSRQKQFFAVNIPFQLKYKLSAGIETFQYRGEDGSGVALAVIPVEKIVYDADAARAQIRRKAQEMLLELTLEALKTGDIETIGTFLTPLKELGPVSGLEIAEYLAAAADPENPDAGTLKRTSPIVRSRFASLSPELQNSLLTAAEEMEQLEDFGYFVKTILEQRRQGDE